MRSVLPHVPARRSPSAPRTLSTPRTLLTLLACAGTLAVAAPALAQTGWDQPVSGNWNDVTKWTFGIPGANTPTTIGHSTPFGVNINLSTGAGTLSITNPGVTLNVNNNVTFSINGDGVNPPAIFNAGTILVNPAGGVNLTRIYYPASGGLSGPITNTGLIRLNAASGDPNSARIEGGGLSIVLTQAATHRIVGSGRLYNFTLANAGIVEADQPAMFLDFLGMGVQNSGTLRSTTGQLQINSSSVTQTPAGVIAATGATASVILLNSSVTGGSLSTSAGGVIASASGTSATLSGVTNTGTFNISNNSTVNLGAADLVNNALININNGAGGNITRLYMADVGALTGSGVVQLNALPADVFSARIEGPGAAVVRTIGAGQTIRGSGVLYNFAPTLLGVIDADTSGRTLLLNAVNVANQGTLRATAGNLDINGSSVTQSGAGNITTSGAGTVSLTNCTINAGILNGAGGLIATTSGTNATLSGVTIQNNLRVSNNSTISVGAVNVINNGTISINNGSGGNITRLYLDAGGVLGTGTILLQALPGDNFSARIEAGGSSILRSIGAGQTVRGAGVIYNFQPQVAGLINADTPGRSLQIEACTVANTGVLRSSAGTLLISNSTINSSAGGTLNSTGGATEFSNSTLSGGGLTASGTGEFRTISGTNTTLQNLDLNAPFKIANNSTANVNAPININSVLTVNSTAGGNITRLQPNPANVTLAGSGSILLNAHPSDNFTARIESGGGNPVTYGPALTIRGSGAMYNHNPSIQGVVDADTAGRTLQLASLNMTLSGQVRATAGQIYLTSTGISGTGTLSASGTGAVLLNTSSLTNIALSTSGPGVIATQTGTNNTLAGVTNNATLNIANNSTLSVSSTITNNATITVNDTAGGNVTRLQPAGGITLAGTGTIRLNANLSDVFSARFEAAGAGTVTYGPGQKITGYGVLYNHTANIQGTLSPGSGVANFRDLLLHSMNASLAPTSTVDIELGGTAPGNFDRVTLTNTNLALNGKLKVTFTGALIQSGSAWTIITGGNLTGDFTSFDLPDLGFGREWIITKTANSYRLLIPCLVADITGVGGPPAQPDGQFTVDDLITFVNEFIAQDGCPGPAPCSPADVTGIGGPPNDPDGELTVDDLIAFVNAFSDGC